MVVGTGRGYFLYVHLLACYFLGKGLSEKYYGPDSFSALVWPKPVSMMVAALLIWLTGRALNRDLPHAIVVVPAQESDEMPAGHTVGFMRLEYTSLIIR